MNDEQAGLLGDGTYRAYWLRMVMRSPQINDSLRVLLMTLALYMDATGRVSVPRDDLARLLGRSARKMADKFKIALESGFLVQVARGQKHQTAVYSAAINGEALSMTPEGHPETDTFSMTPGGHAEGSQGDGYKHPENEGDSTAEGSQGDGYKHPENREPHLSMTPGGHAEDAETDPQHDPRGSSQGFKYVEVVEESDLGDSSLFTVKDAASRQETKKSRRKPEIPIPDDFAVTAQMRAWAKSKSYTVDLDQQTFRFINHAKQNDRRCRDWLHAWRNWIDIGQEKQNQEQQRLKGNGSGSHVPRGPRQNPFQSKRETA
ncbi:hypothetical protein ACIBHX_01695 [Nonomuraea sp. NPDC050536]|uniref:hypothetical protein n=1 Tax=Nonomuraea sp. NPDC050536 TaxID=3364366 RepID=UPI0037CA6218